MNFVPGLRPPIRITGDIVELRAPDRSHYAAWARLREVSEEFLKPWEPSWPQDDLTATAYRRRLRFYGRAMRNDEAYPFFLFRREDEALLGGCTLSNVRRGVAQMATVGYWIGAPYARQGYMTAALRMLVAFVFDELRLHRIEAACLPENEASQRLLKRIGFREEGRAYGYLRIGGRWRDHVLFAMLSDSPRD